jgi:pyridoxal phosphate enzyme (YggS family)
MISIMDSIAGAIASIKAEIGPKVTLVAVSKTKPEKAILEAYHAGHLNFGENRVQELVEKYESLPKDICWHFIGHVQTNKIKYIAPFVHLIHGVDREKVLDAINKEGNKIKRVIPCLLQVHIAQEESKFGFSELELMDLVQQKGDAWPFVSIQGLMGMATFTDDTQQVASEFKGLQQLFDKVYDLAVYPNFKTLSIGMSGDYPIALACGSNMIRVGTHIFGVR